MAAKTDLKNKNCAALRWDTIFFIKNCSQCCIEKGFICRWLRNYLSLNYIWKKYRIIFVLFFILWIKSKVIFCVSSTEVKLERWGSLQWGAQSMNYFFTEKTGSAEI